MIGGMSCPPVDAAASIAPAVSFWYPPSFIIGIVIAPVDATFETALPDTEPKNAEPRIAIFPAPPLFLPAIANEKSEKNLAPPVANSS